MHYRHLFWDMGGTLVDTYPELDQTLADEARAGGRPVPLDDVAGLTRVSTRHAIAQLAERTGLPAARFAEANARLKARWRTQPAPAMPGARALLTDVRAAGGLNLVVTHRDRASAEALLTALDLTVDDLVCAPDGHPRKPDPTMVRLLLERHGLVAGDCLFVGDRPIDAEAAARAGMDAALLVGHHADAANATHVVEHLGELRPLLGLEAA
ncbi:HAD family hydrolase [uncultured Tessaracoccus sp.]|uniref:HAD family hydrolase n=1 Tax=uncultured Tessaracoccus sp. TaxID=905023 RepID=UPI0025DD466A|nr:HAD-IA family hydrolase [uncultured Tessaracoccus sp.]